MTVKTLAVTAVLSLTAWFLEPTNNTTIEDRSGVVSITISGLSNCTKIRTVGRGKICVASN